jgi:hypothetical protein
MRIASDQNIAGYPAVRIRHLMRKTVGGSITLQSVRLTLRSSGSEAVSVLDHLQRDGFY